MVQESAEYIYDADGNRVMQEEVKPDGNRKVELTYDYSVENRLKAVSDKNNLLFAMAYDGDGNRIFQLNYNLNTDDDWKGNTGNGNRRRGCNCVKNLIIKEKMD